MDALGPLLMYMVFGLPNLTEQWIRHSPFDPVERGVEGGPGGSESPVTLQKSVRIIW
jgi:hypothetical protein